MSTSRTPQLYISRYRRSGSSQSGVSEPFRAMPKPHGWGIISTGPKREAMTKSGVLWIAAARIESRKRRVRFSKLPP